MLAGMAKPASRTPNLTKRGAEARLRDLMFELKLLVELFPHLRDSYDADELPIAFIVAKGSGQLKKKTRRKAKK
jgi:hypothetical protein